MICPSCTKEAVCEFHRTERSCLTDHHDEEVERLREERNELEELLERVVAVWVPESYPDADCPCVRCYTAARARSVLERIK